MSVPEGITIRAARPEDLPSIYSLVKELAAFEREPDEPTVTPEQFQLDFKELYDSFVAVSGRDIVGIALYFWGYSTWKGKMLYLDDLVVTPGRRHEGIGSALFNRVVALARSEGAGQLRWQVLDWNEPAISMYRKTGAKFLTDWWTCKLEKPELERYGGI